MCADIAEHELISIRRRLGDAGCADHAAGPADVLDNHLLLQGFKVRLLSDAQVREVEEAFPS